MSNIPTAEEFCNKEFFGFKGELWVGVHKAMINFAKLHVEEALKEASEKSLLLDIYGSSTCKEYKDYVVDKNSILNAYPLTNIK